MTALTALEQRLAQATAGSRELDVDITEACGLAPPGYMPLHKAIGHVRDVPQNHMKFTTFINPNDPPIRKTWEPPLLTSSVDAAIAFCAKVLPGAEYSISTLYGIAHAETPLNGEGGHASAWNVSGNAALALVLATVRALIGKGKAK